MPIVFAIYYYICDLKECFFCKNLKNYYSYHWLNENKINK